MTPIQQLFLGTGSAAATKVQDLFSTDLYTGNGSNRSITNGIDQSGEGALTWIKSRTSTEDQLLFDTARGAGKYLVPGETTPEGTNNTFLSAFNSDGFSLGDANDVNASSQDFVAWTFRKHSKFFDIQTELIDSNTTNYSDSITHQLECDLGVAIFKARNDNQYGQGTNWMIWHRSQCTSANKYYKFDDYGIRTDSAGAVSYDSSNKTFTFPYPAQTLDMRFRRGGGTGKPTELVGYFFAHNNGDGEFGSGGNEDIIKCGQYYGNDSTTGTVVNLGFEPQFVMIRQNGRSPVSVSHNWNVFDSARGVTAGSADKVLAWNTNGTETSTDYIKFTSTGFQLESASSQVNKSNRVYIYIAIRKDQ